LSDTHPAVLYRRATARALEVVRGIREDQFGLPTPCAEWTVQDLLDHLVGGTRYLASALGSGADTDTDAPSGSTPDDLAAGFAVCVERLGDPAALEHRSASPLGFEWSGLEATAGTFMDVLVHTWDLAAATRQPHGIDEHLAEACATMFLPDMPENGRAGGIVGPAVAVPADASALDRLLGAMGRQP
jgi:uncharacterized protein (TIGR03086 family)